MTRKSLTSELKQLQHRHQRLQQQIQQLQDSQRSQQLWHALVVKWCEAVDCITQSIYMTFSDEPLQHAPGDLQQQLFELTSSSGAWLTLEQLLQPDSSTICPPTDPVMPLLRRLVAPAVQQPLQAHTITLEGVCGVLRETCMRLAIKMQHLQEAVLPEERQSVLSEMAELWDRHLQATAALYLKGGQQHIIEQAHCFNLETMQLEPEAAARHCTAAAAAMLPALGLSKQQEELIAVAFRIYRNIMHTIESDAQQLQQQPSQLEVDLSSSSGASSSARVSVEVDRLWGGQQQLEQQQAQSTRLKALLHKEHWARGVACIFLCGGLSYVQLSKAAVMSWPYPLRPGLLGLAIMRQREGRCQQQLQGGDSN